MSQITESKSKKKSSNKFKLMKLITKMMNLKATTYLLPNRKVNMKPSCIPMKKENKVNESIEVVQNTSIDLMSL